MASIAAQYGFADGDVILNHGNNAELKKSRAAGHQLHPGDEVFIPEREPLTLATGQRHKIVLEFPKRMLRLKFLEGDGDPMKGPYKLTAGKLVREGSLDGSGQLEELLPASITQAEVQLGDVTHQILIGHLNPLEDTTDGGLTGLQARLSNLGFAPGAVDGDHGPKTRAALAAFQQAHDLDPTGELDGPTRAKLEEQHGC